jgi:hypothetical protein
MTNTIAGLTPEQTRLALELVDLAKVVLPALFTLLAALLGARAGFRFALRQFRKEKRLEFARQQVTDFYSPMIGCIKRIRASSELRVELSGAANTAWQKTCEEQPKPFLEHEKPFEPFKRQIEDENKRFPRFLLPLYDQVLDTFTKNYWLADKSTKEFYQPFSRYVELWHRYYDQSIPPRVLDEVKIEEEPLVPFYKDLETHLERLRQEIALQEECRTTGSRV